MELEFENGTGDKEIYYCIYTREQDKNSKSGRWNRIRLMGFIIYILNGITCWIASRK